ncbi:hypothetical protein HDU76_012773 [Blyttiomyces sp. JEL0837]|nr:hypothetical protein HDU76_012773 [Blyttiomyces sp. JEL0837]
MQELLVAAAAADIPLISTILLEHPEAVHENDPITGASALHLAAKAGSKEAVELLLKSGHPWNAVDHDHKTAAEYAVDAGHQFIWDLLLAEGIRVEMILSMLARADENDEDDQEEVDEDNPGEGSGSGAPKVSETTTKAPNAEYLNMKLEFSEGKLLDSEANGVMMGWEAPLMKRHAEVIAPREGLDVLNVGFGLGLIDTYLQELKPASHTIIEAHPDVYRKMIEDGWDKKPGVKILYGRWQDVLGELETYDGIFFDTFGGMLLSTDSFLMRVTQFFTFSFIESSISEFYDDLRTFHEAVPNILREDGIYSYFNGLAGSNIFFHAVSCAIAEADLEEMGLTTQTEEIVMETLGDDVWQGVRRAYWTLPLYRLPICRFSI